MSRPCDSVWVRLCVRLCLQALPCSMDVAFFVIQRKEEIAALERAKTAESRVMSVGRRVECETMRTKCDSHVLKTKELKALFWTELNSKVPSMRRLDAIGRAFQRSVEAAQQAFDALLALNPLSSSTMLRYADFLVEVCARVRRSRKCVVHCAATESDVDAACSGHWAAI